MKQKSLFLGLMMGFTSLSVWAVGTENPTKPQAGSMPDNVSTIIEQRCFGCHNTDSKNDKAKEDLDFKTFDGLSTMKKMSSYNKIAEVLEKQEMPPQKFLEKFPDKNVTDEERTVLLEWAKNEAATLIKGN